MARMTRIKKIQDKKKGRPIEQTLNQERESHSVETSTKERPSQKRKVELLTSADEVLEKATKRKRSPKRMDMKIWNFGKPTCKCQRCRAIFWYEERTRSAGKSNPTFGLCCQNGKVKLPTLKEPSAYLLKLLRKQHGKRSKNYVQNIRLYNSMFAFTSIGGKVDKEVNKGSGPYVFKMNGLNYHRIGTLLPTEEGDKPRWAQLYIYDTENEVKNRIEASTTSMDKRKSLDSHIVEGLKNMLDRDNILAKTFRMARDRFKEGDYHDVKLKIINKRHTDGRQYNMPSASEVAALIVNDTTENRQGRDIIVQYKDMKPKRISENHPKFMAMQYPLLFPYGEDGYIEKTPYILKEGTSCKRKHVTMLEYYAYRIQQRMDQSMHLMSCGKLTLQFFVDAFACILHFRLN
ncbi:hypothetical protein ACQ4PT_022845 [Festuca glaucescens]